MTNPSSMDSLELVGLTALMARSTGRPNVVIGLIDGPVAADHPDLAAATLRQLKAGAGCDRRESPACRHGTFIAGMLCARRGSAAPAICPSCTVLIRPIFSESIGLDEPLVATPGELAGAVVECVLAGARVLNLSLTVLNPTAGEARELREVMDFAMRQGTLVVAAAGNQGVLGGTAVTQHAWVIPVAACDSRGRPLAQSNLGSSVGRRGLLAPGQEITSLSAGGGVRTSGGTSVATPFVTGTIALLWSQHPGAGAAEVRRALVGASIGRPRVVPPMLDVTAAGARLGAELARP